MKHRISFVTFFITFLVTSVVGAQEKVRISNSDISKINAVDLGKGCWLGRGQEGEISNWRSDSRVLKMRHGVGDFTLATACGVPKVNFDEKYKHLIVVKIVKEGSRPGDIAELTRVVFTWIKGKRPVFLDIPVTIKTLAQTFQLTLKTGSSAEAATILASNAYTKAADAEKTAANGAGGGSAGGRGITLSLGGFWAFATEGTYGYGSYLEVFSNVKKLSPKVSLSIGGMLSWHQYQLYFIHSPVIRNPEVPASEIDVLAKGRINFALAGFELFAGIGFGGRSFEHSDSMGAQGSDYYIEFTHGNSSFEAIFGAELGVNVWITQVFGLSLGYGFDISLTEQVKNPSTFKSVPRNMGHAISHKLRISVVFKF